MKILADAIIAWAKKSTPNLQIGGSENPYLNRWYVIPHNPIFNIYIHQFIRDDDDRALHDHPWWSLSWLMRGDLFERVHNEWVYLKQGTWRLRSAKFAHRLEVDRGMAGDIWTVFITGPRIREWGFHCPQGWVHWRDFTAGKNGETVGAGCGE